MKEDIRETRFENGVVVLTDRMASVRSATLGFFYRVGSRHEPEHLNGITHFIEHCVFKGTAKLSAKDIAIEQDRLGGNLDAFTTHEETGFFLKVIDDQLSAAFDLLADMLMNPRFDEADLQNEQHVIIEELKQNDDLPDERLSELFHREFFPGHALGMNIAGTPETVRSFDRELTRAFHERNFTAGNLVIVAAGNVEHVDIVERVQSTNFSLSDGRNPKREISAPMSRAAIANAKLAPPVFAAPIAVEPRSDLEQAHIILAVPLVGARSEQRYAADVLANAIGGGTSSRLWQKVREERGLAYSIAASNAMFMDAGYFAVSASTSPDQVEEIVDIVLDEMRWITREGITRDELELMKEQSRASILLGLEDSAGRAASLAQCEVLHGRQIPVEETLRRLDEVTCEEVHALAAAHFKGETIAFAAIGDLDGVAIDRERLAI